MARTEKTGRSYNFTFPEQCSFKSAQGGACSWIQAVLWTALRASNISQIQCSFQLSGQTEPLLSALIGCVKISPFPSKRCHNNNSSESCRGARWQPPSTAETSQTHSDSLPCALHTHPALGSQIQPHGHHLLSAQSLAAAASRQSSEISRTEPAHERWGHLLGKPLAIEICLGNKYCSF